ncbi:MAG: hypothetical protein ACXVCP_00400 [Bdellovibrio sp.]
MAIDSSIYFQQKAPDFGDRLTQGFQNGLNMRKMIDEQRARDKEQSDSVAMSDILRNNTVKNADGSISIDKNAVGQAYGINPQKGLELQQQLANQDINRNKLKQERFNQQVDFFGRAVNGIKDQDTYARAMNEAKGIGLDTSSMPPVWGPEAQQKLHFYAGQAFTAKDQMDQQFKQQELANKKTEIGIQQQNANTNARKVGVMQGQRADANNQKMAVALQKDLDADAGRTGNFGKISGTLISAQKLEQLTAQHPDGNLDPRQMEEYALGLANMVSNGSGAARSQVEALVPHTFWGKAQSVKEWLLNNPQGAEQQAFVKRMSETVQREKELAQTQLNQIRESRLTSHKAYSKADPEGFKSQLLSYGMNPDDYDQNLLRKKTAGNTKAMGTAVSDPHPADNAMVTWAKKNPNAPGAADVLKANGL